MKARLPNWPTRADFKANLPRGAAPDSQYEPGAPGGESKFDCKTQVQTQLRTWGTRRLLFLRWVAGGGSGLAFFLRARALAILLVAL
jgi:hypothetical protein